MKTLEEIFSNYRSYSDTGAKGLKELFANYRHYGSGARSSKGLFSKYR